jgi:sensor histidine kinase YesM
MMFGDEYGVSIQSRHGQGTCVEILVPCRPKPD